VAKVFDSVVKAVCGVVGIVFPTWLVSYLVGWDTIDWHDAGDQLKVCGALVVVLSAFAYVLGRAQAKELEEAMAPKTTTTSRGSKLSREQQSVPGPQHDCVELGAWPTGDKRSSLI